MIRVPDRPEAHAADGEGALDRVQETRSGRCSTGAKVVFIVAGLGRATGSGLAPVVAQLAQENGADTVSVAVMPFGFEEKLRFYSGLALRRLRTAPEAWWWLTTTRCSRAPRMRR